MTGYIEHVNFLIDKMNNAVTLTLKRLKMASFLEYAIANLEIYYDHVARNQEAISSYIIFINLLTKTAIMYKETGDIPASGVYMDRLFRKIIELRGKLNIVAQE